MSHQRQRPGNFSLRRMAVMFSGGYGLELAAQ